VADELLLCTATLTADNLYAANTNTNTNPLSHLVAGATYYQTAQLDTVADVVRSFNEIFHQL
jgi:hypothetical protein